MFLPLVSLVKSEDGKLWLKNNNKHRRSTNEPLRWISEDRFEAYFWVWKREIEFIRNEDNTVTGFIILDEEDLIDKHEFKRIDFDGIC